MQFNFSLPDFSDIKDGGNLDKIEGYLATLNDQLRHALFNIDEENLSENLQNQLNTNTSGGVNKEKLNNIEKKVSELNKSARKIDWLIVSGTSPMDYELTQKAFNLLTKSFDLNGYLTVTKLKSDESLNIHGANIADNTVSQSKLITDKAGMTDLSDNTKGLRIGKELILNNENESCSIYANEYGNIVLNTACSLPFSLALAINDDGYILNVLNEKGDIIGILPLGLQSQTEN